MGQGVGSMPICSIRPSPWKIGVSLWANLSDKSYIYWVQYISQIMLIYIYIYDSGRIQIIVPIDIDCPISHLPNSADEKVLTSILILKGDINADDGSLNSDKARSDIP